MRSNSQVHYGLPLVKRFHIQVVTCQDMSVKGTELHISKRHKGGKKVDIFEEILN